MLIQTRDFLWNGIKDSLGIYWTLLKIVIPMMIVVRIGIGFDLHLLLANWMAPLMSFIDLPPETSLVIVTTLFAGMYGGATILASMLSELEMTVAQATVLTSMMVISHAIPMEQQIVRRAGVRLLLATLIRLVTGIVLAWVLYQTYDTLGVLQQPLTVAWAPDTQIDAPWPEWILNTARSLFFIFWVILALLYVLRLFDITGATRLISNSLSPFLSVMGISKAATNLTMTGALLGMMFGGGLIIREAQAGVLGHRTIFQSLVFMSICHGLIEDTLFAMILGGHISGIFFARIILVVIVMVILNKFIRAMPDRIFYRYFFHAPKQIDKSPSA